MILCCVTPINMMILTESINDDEELRKECAVVSRLIYTEISPGDSNGNVRTPVYYDTNCQSIF
ncbi:hypothetical protein MKMG_00270 [Methanogenium sp. MK-MG]|nr:hypothetical protein MKMG_00270 [Methanogenium sp. MK-MG]